MLETLLSIARHDFSSRVVVSDRLDEIDAIATGINLLAEELHGEVASRRELEAAYANLQAAQAQLVIAEKFAAVGRLANEVAHELNNPATWVLLGLDTVRGRLANARSMVGPDAPAIAGELEAMADTLTDVHAGMERIRSVVADLRTLAPIDPPVAVAIDLNEVVRSSCHLARPAYLSVARLHLDLGAVPAIVGERGRLGQLITNLVVNSAAAIASDGLDNEIVITTRTDGDQVLLAIEDSGPGIPEELFERVFEPYFTTKSSEFGTGLGLAYVRRIAERHGGSARVTRGSLRGARIEVRLPSSRTPIAPAVVVPEPPPPPVAPRRTRILLIDDEPMLLRALASSIEGLHDVVTAQGGEAALAIFERDQAFDLVICDLQMPSVEGVAIYEALARSAPRLLERLVIMSGGAVTARAAKFLENTRPRMLGKPIDLDRVLALARDSVPL
ncbi:hypothetical protein BH11MYX3_BH11MYX3_45230 [soil metagenome]